MPVAACNTGSNPLRLPQGAGRGPLNAVEVHTDDVRVVPPQTFVVNAYPFRDAGAKIMDNDVLPFSPTRGKSYDHHGS